MIRAISANGEKSKKDWYGPLNADSFIKTTVSVICCFSKMNFVSKFRRTKGNQLRAPVSGINTLSGSL